MKFGIQEELLLIFRYRISFTSCTKWRVIKGQHFGQNYFAGKCPFKKLMSHECKSCYVHMCTCIIEGLSIIEV